LPTSIDNILKKTNVKYQLNITATSDVKFENIKVTYKNGSNEDKELTVSGHEYDSDEGTDGRYEDTLIFYIPENSNYSEVLDSIKVQYTLEGSSTPESKAIGKLVYDATAPEMEEETEGSGYLQYSVDGSNWITVDINSANTSNGVYYTNPDFRYRYIVKVTDPDVVSGISGSGVNKVYIDSSREFTEITDASTNTPVSGTPTGIFAYDITNALVNSASLSDTVYASDKSGNVTSGLQLPKLKKTDRAMLINAQVQDNNGNPVSISEITKYTNQGYKLVVTVSSGYEIAEIKLNKIDGTGNNIEYKKTNSLDDNPFDFVGSIDVYNRYTVVAEFDLSAVDNNEWFKNMYITAKDTAATPQTKRFPETEDTYLSDVLYDISEPVEVSSSGSQSSWLKENAFTFEYSSGTKDGSESPITSINYAVSDSTANTSGSISVSGTDTVVSNSGYNVPESTSLEGTKLTYTVTDAAGNTKNFSYNIKIDKTQPDIDLFVNEVKAFEAPLKTAPTIKAVYGDNLTINTVKVTIAGPNGTVVKELETSAIEQINVSKINSYSLASLYGTVVDGKYTVTAYIEDKAGNNRTTSAVSFTIDSTKADISSNIAEGTKSPKTGNYYSSNVGVYFTYKDASTVKPVIKDNDSLVSVDWKKNDDGSYSGYLIVNTEGAHKIAYAVTDSAGNVTNAADIDFILDKTSPVISTTLNNVSYTESKGVVYLTSNATVAVSVSDANEDVGDLNYRVTLTKPDQEAVTSQYVKTESRSFGFTDEGDYTVELYAIDKANNRCDNRSVSFRVDKTAPALTITGANSTTTNEQATVSFNMNEAFWWDASGTITVYRKDGDGIVERQIDTIEFKPTAKSTTISKTYSDTGVYRFEFEAKDKAGHTAMVGGSLTIDANKPTLSISALEADGSKADITNYSVTNQTVSFYAEMTDEFYANKVIQFQGTRTDIDGKVHNIDVSVMGAKANPSTITQDFEDDGTYDITITVTDIVGNEVTKSLHFTIDKTAPVIGDLSKYEGTKKSFDWDEDLEQLVSDLTVCDVHVYLNGREYDGTSDIEDGAYTLLVTAQDEINEMVEKSVEFVLDTKAPSFIITGVEDGEVKEEDYNISVSPQLDEDKLTSVTLNGQVVTITNNVATLTVNSKGDYTLHAEAIDEAGNESSIDISFTYGKKTNSMLWIIIIVAAVIVIGGVIFIIIKKSNKKNN
ncbi:MAG: Ig-like domain repeat protein, partial [Wujia sp.]